MKQKKNLSHSYGFTLLDLCVATAIVIVLAAISIPAVSSWRVSHQLRSEASAVMATLARALENATIQHTRYAVVIAKEQLSIVNDLGKTTSIQRLRPGVIFVPPTPEQIRFSPGFITSPSRLILMAQDNHCEITISLRGRIQSTC